ncbi:MAG: PAS domain S-box protein [Verrucomicrobia bacterium]|nr:PAS domain S-box protein [Verrucomicrobiota bacterium]
MPVPFDSRYLRFTGVATLVVTMAVIAGWIGNWRILSSWMPGGSPMVVNTVVCLGSCAVALLLLGRGGVRVAAVLGLLSALLAGVVLSQYSLDRSWGVDDLFWRHATTLGPGSTPGRMAPNTAAALVLVGLSVALMAVRPDRRVWLMIGGVGVLTLAALPLLSYFAALQTGNANYRGMSLPTVVCVLLFGVTILRQAGSATSGREGYFPPAMAAAVSLLVAVGLVSTQSNAELIESSHRVVHAHLVQVSIERAVARVARMETNARGYALSGSETMRVASVNHAKELLRLLAVLDGQVAEDSMQRSRAVELRRRAVEKIEHNDRVLTARQTTGGVDAPARIVFAPAAATTNGMIAVGSEMRAHENRLLARWEAEMAQLANNTRTTQIFGSLVALALVGLTMAQTRRAALARRAAEAETRTANTALSQRVAELAAARAEIESVNRLQRAVLDGTVQSVISTNPEGLITSFNAGAEKMLGYTRAEVVGRTTPEILHLREEIEGRAAELSARLGRTIPAGFEALVARARLGEVDEREWTHVRRDGSRLPVLLTVTALRDEAGGIAGFLGIGQDLTDRRRAERALADQERRLRLVLEQLPVGVRWVRQVDGRREAVLNPAHEKITGVPLGDEAVPGIYLSRTHPDDVPRQEAGLARLRRGEIEQFSMEKRYVKPDGGVTWVLITWLRRRLPGEGNFEELATLKDITERKQDEAALRSSEERTRLFVAHSPASVAMLDRDMRYVVVSREWMEAYKLTGDVLGKSHYDVFPEIPEEWKAVHRRCLAGAVERREADLFVRADGTRQWLRWEVRPWFDAGGAIGGIVMFAVDITGQKKLEENLAVARDEALEASRLKSEFLATISHEIRTPMNAVIGMAGLLAETPLNSEQEEMARTILGGAENLLGIINDLLDFSRIEAGRLRLDPVDFDFGRVVEDTAALLAQRAHEKGLKLACEFESMPATLLLGDAGRVRQVLTNLVGNAIKFTDTGGVTIRTRLVAGAAGRTRMRVAVHDTGIGIAPEARRLLFQPFTQVDGSPTRRFGGTGLGLAICRQLVELMNGEIGCESEPGHGSVFWFEVAFAVRGPLGAEPAGGGFTTPAATGGGQRLLLVEDNPANQRVAVLLLARMGYDVAVAANGQAALAELAARRFDGVLMDCQMPVLDGYAATRQIRSGRLAGVDARIPIVALTAYARAEDRARCLEAGMNDHVTKPIRPAELRTVLARCGLAPGETAAPAPGRRASGVVFDAEALAAARALPGNEGPSLLPELVRLYLGDEAARLAQLDRLAAAQQAELLADEVHNFGGNAASFGGLEVRRVALALEEVARAADWGAVTVQRQRLHEACARLRAEIARLNLTAG